MHWAYGRPGAVACRIFGRILYRHICQTVYRIVSTCSGQGFPFRSQQVSGWAPAIGAKPSACFQGTNCATRCTSPSNHSLRKSLREELMALTHLGPLRSSHRSAGASTSCPYWKRSMPPGRCLFERRLLLPCNAALRLGGRETKIRKSHSFLHNLRL